MADNTTTNTGSGGDVIATDDLATINGGAVGSAVKVQRVKVGFGSDSDFRDTDASHGLPVQPQSAPAATTGSITTAATTVGPVTLGAYDGVSLVVSGTYAGVNLTFEASNDNTVWFPVMGARSDTGIIEATSGVLTANQTRQWDMALGEALYFRVRSTAWTSGSAAINIQPGMFATDPVISVVAQGPAASGAVLAGNPVLVAGSDGTNARSVTVDASGRLTVVGVTGTSALFMQGAAASAATIAGNPVLMGGTFTTTLPTVTTGQAVNIQTTARGEQLVAISSGATAVAVKAASTAAATTDPSLVVSVAGANSAIKIGDGTNSAAVKAASTAAAATDPAVVVGLSPNMAATLSAVNSAATTNATSVKASAGTVFSVCCSNTGGAAAFVKLYNLATAPTVGTSVPVLTISIPASGTVTVDFGTFGSRFGTGIALAITNLAADTDTTAVAAAQVKVLTNYV